MLCVIQVAYVTGYAEHAQRFTSSIFYRNTDISAYFDLVSMESTSINIDSAYADDISVPCLCSENELHELKPVTNNELERHKVTFKVGKIKTG